MTLTIDWDHIGSDGSQTLSENGQSVDVTVSTPKNGEGKEWFVENGMLKNWDVTHDSSADIRFSEEVENVKFTLLDVDRLDEITIMTKDADGNPVPVSFEVTGVHSVNGNTVTGTQTNAPGPGASNDGQDIEVCIAGPLKTFWIVLDDGPERDYSGTVAVSDITFDLPSNLDGTVDGTAGDDLIDLNYDQDPEGDKIDNNDAIVAGEGPQDDIVNAGAGNDTVVAGEGDDFVMPDEGDDKIYGGEGDDDLRGGAGNDMVFGGADSDEIHGGAGNDMLIGGGPSFDGKLDFNDLNAGDIVGGQYAGNGVTISSGSASNPIMIFDTANPTGGDHDLATNNLGNVLIVSEDGDSSDPDDNGRGGKFIFNFDSPAHVESLGFLDIEGGAWIKLYDEHGNLIKQIDTAKTADNGQLTQHINVDGVARMEVIISGSGAIDNLCYKLDGSVGDAADTIFGGKGDDYIDGQLGNDSIDGGIGNDTMLGGEGDDRIFGNDGNDLGFGGAGNDVMGGADFGDDEYYGGAGDDMMETSFGDDTLYGGSGNDNLWASSDNDLVFGGTGDDSSFGGSGHDTVHGDDGNDTLSGGSGDDTVFGGDGNDVIEGDALYKDDKGPDGDDTLFGGAGDDMITGGEGADEIYGGDDADTIKGGAGDTVDGGAGGHDYDVLDLTGEGPFYITGPGGVGDPIPDSNGNGIDGQIVFVDADGNPTGDVLDFVEIEKILGEEINRGPDADADDFDAGEDDPAGVIGNVLDNDSDPDGDALEVFKVGGDEANLGQPTAGSNGGLITIAADGTVTFDPNGDFEHLGVGETAETTITYMVSDGNGGMDTETVTITVNGVNDGPNAEDNSYVVDQDEAAGDVDGNAIDDDTGAGADSDPENDALDVVAVNGNVGNVGNVVAGSNGGLFTINADGTIDFDANGEFDGLGAGETAQTSVTYTIADEDGAEDTATVNFTINGTNDDPIACPDLYIVTEDETGGDVDGNVITNPSDNNAGLDIDPDGDTLTVVGVNAPDSGVGENIVGDNGGIFVINPDGSFDFSANGEFEALAPGESAETSVTYTVSDGNGGTATTTLTIRIDGVNDGPVALDDDLAADEDDAEGVIGNVLDNDSDPEGDALEVFKVGGDEANLGQPTAGDNGGLITIDADGTVTFDPNGDFEALGDGETAETTITYMVQDPSGEMSTATVTVTVTGTNDAPTAVMDSYTTDEDTVADLGNVLGNDTDPENDPLSVSEVNGNPADVGTPVAGDNGGLVTINEDGSVSFDPNGEFDGLAEGEETTTTVVYTVTDPDGATDTAEVVITVTGTNDAPVAIRNDYSVKFDETTGDVDGNVLTDDTGNGVDSDPENDPLTVVGVGAPNSGVGVAVAGTAGGLFTILADGTVDFDANGEFDDLGLNDTRTTTVEYTISDGNGGTSTAIASFTVGGINDGTVQGTDGDDIINPDIPYVDADGDVVDNNDAILDGDTGNDDLILGFGGDDSIDAGDGDDRVFGGDGNDTIDGGVGNDGLVGNDGDDIIEGNDGDDMIFGNAGNDELFGGEGMDKLEGGTGDDLLEGGDGNDDLWAGAGNDRVVGGDGDDVANGGSGNDVILGNAGNDTLDGASGDDTIRGGEGDDSIDGDFGHDSIVGGEGSDVVDGGNGNDIIDTGNHADPAFDNPYPGLGAPDADPNNDKDTVFGGLGDDTITTGDDADSIDGGGGRDYIDAGIDNDIVDAGTGNDTVIGGEGVDVIEGGEGDDVLYGGLDSDTFDIVDTDPDGNPVDLLPGNNIDTVFGGAGNDTIFGRDDADVLFGGTGNDVIDGGIDNDVITGGEGEDQLFGGQGSDTFLGGNGGDVVVGGEDAPSGTFPDGADIDVLDLTGSNVERIEYVPGDPEAGTVFFMDGTTMTFSEIENVIPCFTPGTTIATPRGERLVEELKVGDKIITRDNGIQEIAWVGHKAMNGKQLAANPHLKPILIKAGALGGGLPERDMLVSPNHRVLVASEKTQLYFEEREVLAAAKHMTGADGVHAVNVMQTTYVHFMFERHEVVLSNGAWTESFQPGDYSLKGIGNSQRNEIFELFPELATTSGLEGYQAARKALKKHEARLLMK